MNKLLVMESIIKTFPGVKALSNVNFDLNCGEVHALMGENGAGKSTLMKILTGSYIGDSGKIFIDGELVNIDSPKKAQLLGINIIHQEIHLIPHLSVAENIYIGYEPYVMNFKHIIDYKKMNEMAAEILKEMNLDIAPTTEISKLSIAQQQMVSIARVIALKSKIVIMDEPTATLTESEIRFLYDVIDKLSVQVHPNDEYAAKYNDDGKTELWYVLDAKPGASLIYGLKNGVNKEELSRAINENKIEEVLNKIPVKKGDVLYIPSGTVHAMLEGVIIAEIQQNSNITYRLFDWNRTDSEGNYRELHIDKALDVIKLHNDSRVNDILERKDFGGYSKKILSRNKFFSVEEIDVHKEYINKTDDSKFYIYIIVDGDGEVKYKDGKETLGKGSAILIPATMGEYRIIGELKMLRVY